MKRMNSLHRATIAALVVVGLGGTLELSLAATDPAVADPASATSAPAPAPHRWRARHGEGQAGLMPLLKQLDLTDAQRQQIRTLLGNARAQMRSERQGQPVDLVALGDPANPQHEAAVQAAKMRAVDRVQQRSDLQQQIYALLTPAQQQKLPQLLAEAQQHLAAKEQK